MMKNSILSSLRALFVLTIMTGVLYPLLLTFVAWVFFPHRANGSLIVSNGRIVGSVLIGQRFESPRYFQPRPSAIRYNPVPSGASNLGPTSRALCDSVQARRTTLVTMNGLPPNAKVPTDMLFASGSGVDPHISPESALMQVQRVARARGLDSVQAVSLEALIKRVTEPRQFGLLGEPRVNVLELNLALDKIRWTDESVSDPLPERPAKAVPHKHSRPILSAR
jgi:K+-transporting ATPase ATPase C chain